MANVTEVNTGATLVARYITQGSSGVASQHLANTTETLLRRVRLKGGYDLAHLASFTMRRAAKYFKHVVINDQLPLKIIATFYHNDNRADTTSADPCTCLPARTCAPFSDVTKSAAKHSTGGTPCPMTSRNLFL